MQGKLSEMHAFEGDEGKPGHSAIPGPAGPANHRRSSRSTTSKDKPAGKLFHGNASTTIRGKIARERAASYLISTYRKGDAGSSEIPLS
jgi:hypothetical protein